MSGLSASMWTGVSGLQTHSKNMNVIGNNLANVSTLGFKSQRMDFNDYLYLTGSSASGPTQIGAGSGVYALLGDFSQGAFESTNSATDLAINGKGFFGVRNANSEQIFYTRAGDFYFSAQRELINPANQRLQGWAVDNSTRNDLSFKPNGTMQSSSKTSKVESVFVGHGTPKDIILDSWNCTPQRTTSVKMITGLQNDYEKNDKSNSGSVNPVLQLFNTWDGSKVKKNPPDNHPMPDTAYAHQSTITTYDEGGTPHELTIYYDQVDPKRFVDTKKNPADNTLPNGYSVYEYIVTMDPKEDMRKDNNGNKLADTKEAGMLMTGVLVFDAAGKLVNQSAYTYNGAETEKNNKRNLEAWSPTKFSVNGLPTFTANWNGKEGANHVWDYTDRANAPAVGDRNNAEAQKYLIELDLGLKTGGDWTTGTAYGAGDPTAPQGTLADITTVTDAPMPADPNQNWTIANYKTIGLMQNPQTQTDATVNNLSSFVDQYRSQNGYSSGILSSYNIDEHGVVYGIYNNNQTLALYQITMYDFHNQQGLRREGGNLYSATTDSGEPRIGAAGDNGFGETKAYNIENSNVDMTNELVRMISCQRGFQSNSKIVTTVDTMLETVIGMKR